MGLKPAFRSLLIMSLMLASGLWTGCGELLLLQQRRVGEYGHFEFRATEDGSNGLVIGVPRGGSEPAAVEYARFMRDRLGAGLVLAYDFARKRIPVSQPLIHTGPIAWAAPNSVGLGSVYSEFRTLLRSTVGGPIEFYVGLRAAKNNDNRSQRIEVASSGLAFEQLEVLKKSYAQIRDRLISSGDLPRVEIALNPLDDISWNADGVKNHGVLLLARRGLILQIPPALADARVSAVYQSILAAWINQARSISEDTRLARQETDVTLMPLGRIDSIAAGNNGRGIVIGAPHGSFDWYTGELVEVLSYRVSLPAVIARGFTPTECGGWRIDVNRPTERRYPTDTIERATDRAADVYRRYSAAVLKIAGGSLNLYIDLHQNSEIDDIDVATVGITRPQAEAIKNSYREIRDRVLREFPDVVKLKMMIEPVDQVVIGAWAAKDNGILKLAKRAIHFEMPSHRVLHRSKARRAYLRIFAELLREIVNLPNTQWNCLHSRSPIQLAC